MLIILSANKAIAMASIDGELRPATLQEILASNDTGEMYECLALVGTSGLHNRLLLFRQLTMLEIIKASRFQNLPRRPILLLASSARCQSSGCTNSSHPSVSPL